MTDITLLCLTAALVSIPALAVRHRLGLWPFKRGNDDPH